MTYDGNGHRRFGGEFGLARVLRPGRRVHDFGGETDDAEGRPAPQEGDAGLSPFVPAPVVVPAASRGYDARKKSNGRHRSLGVARRGGLPSCRAFQSVQLLQIMYKSANR
ncbi:hypothetical protein STRIP9103_04169 [Streptomyces ipomoeae 91-03]|uniref:Uncharacterized protein n=1 Tax=Streptomyces ipomoeae 91-03 TaxID=698759 RepID=L1KJV5_9ACTN|nr:hypothetical protein STRIP9103_04169 [Streptomyces ipomoeae 91-03]